MLQYVTNLLVWSNYHYTSGGLQLVTDVCFAGISSIKFHFRQMCYALSPCLKLTIKAINTRNTKRQKMMESRCCGWSLFNEISKLKELWSPYYYNGEGANHRYCFFASRQRFVEVLILFLWVTTGTSLDQRELPLRHRSLRGWKKWSQRLWDHSDNSCGGELV